MKKDKNEMYIEKLIQNVRKALEEKKTGGIRINMYMGGVTNINSEFTEKIE